MKPLFIIGNPRSGTSLLRLILTCHPDVIIPPECGFIIWLKEKYSSWSLENSADTKTRTDFIDDLFNCKKFETWSIDRSDLEAGLVKNQPKSYSELCALIYSEYAKKFSKRFLVWGDKNNFHINHLQELNAVFPEARFLHIVRDGRDVFCSYKEVMSDNSASPYAPKLQTAIINVAREWSENVTKVDSYLSTLDSGRRITITYEDLVVNQKQCLKKICDWLLIEFDEEMLNFHIANTSLQLEPSLTLDWKRRTLEPMSDETVGRYRKDMSDIEQNEFLDYSKDAMSKFKYI